MALQEFAMEPSVLIVGAGTFGTSTAYHLALSYKDASRVTIIDRSQSPPKPAAAIDINRVIRTDYPSSLYCNLAYEAIHAWFWSLELGPFFHKVGWMMMDEEGSNLSERVRKVFHDRGSHQTEDVALDKLHERWDILKGTETRGFQNAYFNPEAGWCNAAAATASIMKAAEKRGVKRLTGDVKELLLDTGTGRIKSVCTADGQYLTADKIVLATGAWTSSMLSPIEDALNIPEQDRVERQVKATGAVAAYYRVSEEETKRLSDSKLPIVVYGGVGEVIPPSNEDHLVKYSNSRGSFTNTITTRSGRKISAPPSDRSQNLVPEKLKRETEEVIASKVMPELTRGKQADYWRICWDALTPTEDWLLCKHPHPKLSNLYLAVGGSFHSYKFVNPQSERSWCARELTCAFVNLDSCRILGNTCSTSSRVKVMEQRKTRRGVGKVVQNGKRRMGKILGTPFPNESCGILSTHRHRARPSCSYRRKVYIISRFFTFNTSVR